MVNASTLQRTIVRIRIDGTKDKSVREILAKVRKVITRAYAV